MRAFEDLSELLGNAWDEELVLDNFRLRFLLGKPYTGVGSIMVAVNPCRKLAQLYDRDKQREYIRYKRTDLPAHIYAISAAAYRDLCQGSGGKRGQGYHQTIALTGDPSSGKSFTAGLIVDHIIEAVDITRNDISETTNDTSEIPGGSTTNEFKQRGETERLRRMTRCRRFILESFGNAQMFSNKSSSRFMAHTKVLFSENGSELLGTEVDTVLLETSRLCMLGRSSEQRPFHVFYQVLNADETIKKRLRLNGKSACDFVITASEDGPRRREAGTSYDAAVTSPPDLPMMSWSTGYSRSCSNTLGSNGDVTDPSPGDVGFGGPQGSGAIRNMVDAMTTFGVTEGERNGLLQALSAILHLGQIQFVDISQEDVDRDSGVTEVNEETPLEAASEMLGCNKHHLRNALLTRSLAAGGAGGAAFLAERASRGAQEDVETLTIPLKKYEANRARDKLVQEIYLRLFRWLVKRTNACTSVQSGKAGVAISSIGVLDTFGLENLNLNGLDQLCKNYAVERLHGTFVQDFSRGTEDSKGGIFQSPETGRASAQQGNNRKLMAMFDSLICLANEECLRPEGSGSAFVDKLLGAADRVTTDKPNDDEDENSCTSCAWPVYVKLNKSKNQPKESCIFYIRHFAGPLEYNAADLLERNRGGIGQNLLDLLDDACTNVLVGEGSRSSRYRDGRRATTADGSVDHRRRNLHQRRHDETLFSLHRRQLTKLLRNIDETTTRHVVCVTPNSELSATFLDDKALLRQLSAAGVAATARAQSISLPTGQRVDKRIFFRDFRDVPGVIERVLNNEGDCCQLGHDTILFREGVWESMDRQRKAFERRSCEIVQRAWRRHARRTSEKAEWARNCLAEAEKRAAENQRQWEQHGSKQAWEDGYVSQPITSARRSRSLPRHDIVGTALARLLRLVCVIRLAMHEQAFDQISANCTYSARVLLKVFVLLAIGVCVFVNIGLGLTSDVYIEDFFSVWPAMRLLFTVPSGETWAENASKVAGGGNQSEVVIFVFFVTMVILVELIVTNHFIMAIIEMFECMFRALHAMERHGLEISMPYFQRLWTNFDYNGTSNLHKSSALTFLSHPMQPSGTDYSTGLARRHFTLRGTKPAFECIVTKVVAGLVSSLLSEEEPARAASGGHWHVDLKKKLDSLVVQRPLERKKMENARVFQIADIVRAAERKCSQERRKPDPARANTGLFSLCLDADQGHNRGGAKWGPRRSSSVEELPTARHGGFEVHHQSGVPERDRVESIILPPDKDEGIWLLRKFLIDVPRTNDRSKEREGQRISASQNGSLSVVSGRTARNISSGYDRLNCDRNSLASDARTDIVSPALVRPDRRRGHILAYRFGEQRGSRDDEEEGVEARGEGNLKELREGLEVSMTQRP